MADILCNPMGGKPNEPISNATQTADLTYVDGLIHMPRPGQTGNYTNEGVQGAPGRKGAPLNPEPMPSGTSGGWWRKPPGGSGATDTEARQCRAARARYGWAGRHGTAVSIWQQQQHRRKKQFGERIRCGVAGMQSTAVANQAGRKGCGTTKQIYKQIGKANHEQAQQLIVSVMNRIYIYI